MEKQKGMKTMSKKILWIDTETTGLDASVHALREIAILVEINDKIVYQSKIELNPFTYNRPVLYDEYALGISGKTMTEIKEYPDSKRQFEIFLREISKWLDVTDKDDKFMIAGFNTAFDIGFLVEWFKDNNNIFFDAYFGYAHLDVLAYSRMLAHNGFFETDSHKLTTLCKHFNIKIQAHQALSDIGATYELNKRLSDLAL
jgi:DNA polymerase III alpha subunit (gram-positive type)